MSDNRKIYVFSAAFFLVNVLQAIFFPITEDETYYWMYSRALAWGYYDHPPMIAVLIKMGTTMFSGALGTRLMSTLLFSADIILMWELLKALTPKASVRWFVWIVPAMLLLQMPGFIATPDAPLLFFSLLFLYMYSRFLRDDNWANANLLGLAMGCMLLSKYHGFLVLGAVFISNWKLIRNPRFIGAGILGAAVCLPHLLWLIENEFPSVMYHLYYRPASYAFEIKHPFEFILNTFVALSIVGIPLTWLWIRTKADSDLSRAIRYIVFGVLAFFTYFAFRGHVQAQWLLPIVAPAVLLGLKAVSESERPFKSILITAKVSVVLIVIIRIVLASQEIVNRKFYVSFSDKNVWAQELREFADGRPIIFPNGFQAPSLYNFFTGDTSTVLPILDNRRTQYSIWKYDEAMAGREVMVIHPTARENVLQHKQSDGNTTYASIIPDFVPFEKIEMEISQVRVGQASVTGSIALHNPYNLNFTFLNSMKPRPVVVCLNARKEIVRTIDILAPTDAVGPDESMVIPFKFSITDLNEFSAIQAGMETDAFGTTLHGRSREVDLTVYN